MFERICAGPPYLGWRMMPTPSLLAEPSRPIAIILMVGTGLMSGGLNLNLFRRNDYRMQPAEAASSRPKGVLKPGRTLSYTDASSARLNLDTSSRHGPREFY